MNTRNVRNWAEGLGWFGIALGAMEIVAARPLARALGAQRETWLRVYGVREIATGILLLVRRRKALGVWGRVAGDALDVATLVSTMAIRRGRARTNAAIAMAAVAPVVVMDVVCGQQLGLSA